MRKSLPYREVLAVSPSWISVSFFVESSLAVMVESCAVPYGSPKVWGARASGNLHYAAFDVLWLNGKELRGLPLTCRKRAL